MGETSVQGKQSHGILSKRQAGHTHLKEGSRGWQLQAVQTTTTLGSTACSQTWMVGVLLNPS